MRDTRFLFRVLESDIGYEHIGEVSFSNQSQSGEENGSFSNGKLGLRIEDYWFLGIVLRNGSSRFRLIKPRLTSNTPKRRDWQQVLEEEVWSNLDSLALIATKSW